MPILFTNLPSLSKSDDDDHKDYDDVDYEYGALECWSVSMKYYDTSRREAFMLKAWFFFHSHLLIVVNSNVDVDEDEGGVCRDSMFVFMKPEVGRLAWTNPVCIDSPALSPPPSSVHLSNLDCQQTDVLVRLFLQSTRAMSWLLIATVNSITGRECLISKCFIF